MHRIHKFEVGDTVEVLETVVDDQLFSNTPHEAVKALVGKRKDVVAKGFSNVYELGDGFVYQGDSLKLVQRYVSPIRLWLNDKIESYLNESEPSVEMGELLQELDTLLKMEEQRRTNNE